MGTGGQQLTARQGAVISTAQLKQSYAQLPISLAVSLANALILIVVIWRSDSLPVTLGWLLLLCLVSGARLLSLRNFQKAAQRSEAEHAIWTRRFVAGAFASGLVWGLAGVLLFHPDSFPHQVFLAFVLGGMVAGALPLLSSVDHAYWYFAIPAVTPISMQMLTRGDSVHVIMGLMIVIFTIAMLASSQQVRRLFLQSDQLRRELMSSYELSSELNHLARLDTLTGIANRRLFEEELRKEWRRAERDRETLAVILIDIDHFKEYNDRYGHPAGDDCLIEVAQAMRRSLSRPADIVARIGGEEFALLLPETTHEGAIAVARQIQKTVRALDLPHEASPVAAQVTLSFGIAASDARDISSSAELVHAADRALYAAKHRGRDAIAG